MKKYPVLFSLIVAFAAISLGIGAAHLQQLPAPTEFPCFDNIYLVDARDYPDDCFELWSDYTQIGYYCPTDTFNIAYSFQILD